MLKRILTALALCFLTLPALAQGLIIGQPGQGLIIQNGGSSTLTIGTTAISGGTLNSCLTVGASNLLGQGSCGTTYTAGTGLTLTGSSFKLGDANLTYSGGVLTTTTFVGALTGHASLDLAVSGLGSNVQTALGLTLNGSGAVAATTSPTFVTPVLGAATGTSLAIGGCTLGTNAACVTGTTLLSGNTVIPAANGLAIGDVTTSVTANTPGLTVALRANSASTVFSEMVINYFDNTSSVLSNFIQWQQSGGAYGCVLKSGMLDLGSCSGAGSQDPYIRITRPVNNATQQGAGTGNAHGIEDNSSINRTNGGPIGYASYDNSGLTFNDNSGATNYDHYAALQDASTLQMTGTINNEYSVYSGITLSSGTLTNRNGVYVAEVTGTGTITNEYGVYVAALTKGTTLNYAFYSAGTTPSLLGGTITAAAHISTAAAPTVAAGQIGYGGTVSAAAACATASPAATGCIVVNIAGTNHYVPYQ